MNYPSIRIEGSILSHDILERIEDMPGQKPIDFGFDSSSKVKDEIARAWADAQDYWRIFQRKIEALKPESAATTETRQQWIAPLLGLLGYQLEYQPKGAELDGKIYNISHIAFNRAQAPVQIIGYREPAGLDRKPERSKLRMSAHAIVQEFLNLNDQLYGLVTNGRVLRLLRDSSRLIKLSYLEFDLDRIFTDGLFSDFAVLYRLLHATRLPLTNDSSAESLIERYHQDTIEQGTRIREGLRAAVTEALEILGTGFVAHPENHSLREQIDAGMLERTAFFSHLLRLIYRLLFLNVVEERGLIFPKGTPATRLRTYFDYYSVQRLRRLARTRGLKTERHHDAWMSLLSTFQIFERPDQATKLGTTAFGGQLFDPRSLGPLSSCRLTNAALFDALDRLCSFDDPETRQRLPVNFGALATEEFGSVYESLLELHPVIETAPSPHFSFKEFAGNDRKTSGSYYTPTSLVDCLLDSALGPVLEERINKHPALGYPTAEASILALKVCDPACGSGHFLIAAAQRIARRLAQIRAGDDEPSPDQMRHALREVISRCIYAVDINPMSVELCRVALWLEAVEPGKPLSFLDHHIRVGNSLLGATTQLIAAGLPDEPFAAIEGDDKKACTLLKKRNKTERGGLGPLFAQQDAETQARLQQSAAALADLPDDRPEEIRAKELAFRLREQTDEYRQKKQLADTWCAAFVIRKFFREPGRDASARGITQGHLNDLAAGHLLPVDLAAEVASLSSLYQFFHWHLAFPEVFANGGFDCVLGNPPWEMMEAEDGEAASNEFARLQLCFKSNQYKVLNGRRDLYKLFLVNCAALPRSGGRLGFLTPLGVFIEDDASEWRQSFFKQGSLLQLRHFQNHKKRFFPRIHASTRFCAVTFSPNSQATHTFSTVAVVPEDLPTQYYVTVPPDEFDEWLGSERSATIYPTKPYALLHRTVSKSLRHSGNVNFKVVAEFHASSDKEFIKSHKPDTGWVLLKNRNIHYFDYAYAPHEAWIEPDDVKRRLSRKGLLGEAWFSRFPRLVFRDIARNDDERTLIACLAPPGAVSSYDTPMYLPECDEAQYPTWIAFYGAAFSAYLFDFLIRPVVDKHIKGYTLARITWPSPQNLPRDELGLKWFVLRMLELVYTTSDFALFAQDCGWPGPPFRRDEERRFLLRCELDAAFFHLYLPAGANGDWRPAEHEPAEDLVRLKASFPSPRDAVGYIMDSFPIVKRKDEEKWGDYRTKRVILEIYDALAESIRTGQPYQTRLDPPPADARICHPTKCDAEALSRAGTQ